MLSFAPQVTQFLGELSFGCIAFSQGWVLPSQLFAFQNLFLLLKYEEEAEAGRQGIWVTW